MKITIIIDDEKGGKYIEPYKPYPKTSDKDIIWPAPNIPYPKDSIEPWPAKPWDELPYKDGEPHWDIRPSMESIRW